MPENKNPLKKYDILGDTSIGRMDFGLGLPSKRPQNDSSILSGIPEITGGILNTIKDTKRDYNQTKQNLADIRNELMPVGSAIKKKMQRKNIQTIRYTPKFYVYVNKSGVVQRFTFDNFDMAQRFAIKAANSEGVTQVKGPIQQVL